MAPTAITTTSTTTGTTTEQPIVKLNSTASSSTVESLRSLYNRAARAFLLRNVPLTDSLLESAFALLSPPSFTPLDSLYPIRRKWDILRITFETTIYSDPPPNIPEQLRQRALSETPQSLIKSLHAQSLNLFTPVCHSGPKPDAAYLPPQVLTTLAMSSLKLDCADVGREMIEEWLARRGLVDGVDWEGEGYEKVIETYCLRILPRLELLDYAQEFLEYESEMPHERRQGMRETLKTLHEQTLASSIAASKRSLPDEHLSFPSTASPAQRSISPSPSTSSSLSTTSTQTVIPGTPRANGHIAALTSITAAMSASTSSSAASTSSSSTAKGRNRPRDSDARDTRHAVASRGQRGISPIPYPPLTSSRSPERRSRPPDTYSLIRTSLATAGRYLAQTRLLSMIVIFTVLLLFRLFRGRRRHLGGGAAAELVRGRLKHADAGGVLGRMWSEVVQVVVDTIKMGGGGLV